MGGLNYINRIRKPWSHKQGVFPYILGVAFVKMSLVIPTVLEENFTQADGGKGKSIKDAFSFSLDKVFGPDTCLYYYFCIKR